MAAVCEHLSLAVATMALIWSSCNCVVVRG